ncbi:MAG: HemK2/MTQ2 family protein methyltransferase [Candidatus Nanohaloarchaea archaeon]
MVYQPAEDSYLVADQLEDLEGLKVLDMGTGSGFLARKMYEQGAQVTAVDVDPGSVEEARQKLPDEVKVLESDLFSSVEGVFDLIVFNPPYLKGEEGLGDENVWLGGEKGIEVAERFLKKADSYLEEQGKALVVLSSKSDYRELVDEFELEIAGSRELWFETLFVARYK